jgi:hypothetical protein
MDQNTDYVKVKNFQVINFLDKKIGREAILIYALGEDGIMYEFGGGQWTGYPIRNPSEFKPASVSNTR